jgi:uncharacterized protein YbaA (DUF1428 family)
VDIDRFTTSTICHDPLHPIALAREGEKIVFSWQVWSDKATLDAAEAKMRDDARFEVAGEIPFDPKRLILGCFKPIYAMGR